MEPFPVVEQLDVPENGLPHVFDVLALHDGIGQRVLDKFGIDVLAHGVAHRLLVTQ